MDRKKACLTQPQLIPWSLGVAVVIPTRCFALEVTTVIPTARRTISLTRWIPTVPTWSGTIPIGLAISEASLIADARPASSPVRDYQQRLTSISPFNLPIPIVASATKPSATSEPSTSIAEASTSKSATSTTPESSTVAISTTATTKPSTATLM